LTFLEKDPGRRFQDPGELLKAIPTITGRIEAGRRISREGLDQMPPAASRIGDQALKRAADALPDLVTSKGESLQPSEVLDLHGPLFDSELSDPTKGRSAARTNGNV